jgi:para-nitrobenzyl esterase
MKIRRTLFIPGILIMLSVACLAGEAWSDDFCTEPVMTSSGLVRGMSESETSTCVWRGIPYAAPPVGEHRWKSPEPHPGWSGVRDATEFGNRCMQKGIFTLEVQMAEEGMSEDCLYLNIWRPAKSGLFPVMVWIHGGGYYGGAANTGMYLGDRLAEAGEVVVVSMNYRLNIFGFFALPALREEDPNRATGGQGSLDQVAALKWVHENIAGFGGDPDNVTIFGESAGGMAICTMLATPLTRGLFQRAILESGGCEQSRALEPGYKSAMETASKLGCDPDDLKCLRELSARKVLEKGSGGMPSMDAMPHHDGYLLTDTPLAMIRSGDYNKVPFMAGHNRDEFGKALKLIPGFYFTRPARYEKKLINAFKLSAEEAKRLVELYPLSEFNNRPVEAYGRMLGVDAALACPTYQGLSAAAEQQPDAYFYRFDYDDFKYGKYMGAAHCMEVPFIFNTMDRLPMNQLFKEKHIAEARELQKIIQGYWVNFAHTGDPNKGPGTKGLAALPHWPRFEPDSQKIQVLDINTRTEPADSLAERCAFWQDYTDEHGSLQNVISREK